MGDPPQAEPSGSAKSNNNALQAQDSDMLKQAFIKFTKSVQQVSKEDLAFQRSLHPKIDSRLNGMSMRLGALSTRLLAAATTNTKLQAPCIEDIEDVESRWGSIADVCDSLLEKADTSLDTHTGRIKRQTTDLSSKVPGAKFRPEPLSSRLRWAKVRKPQLDFEVAVDNYNWKPRLTTKPHAAVPLDQSIVCDMDTNGYQNPYMTEILGYSQYPDTVYRKAEPIRYLPVDTTKATWVDTFQGVLEMLQELKKATVIAVDLEHHDYRSYMGLTCLMQISTREKDWIVDTLKPWKHRLEVLNEVFADPNIVKVFHGSYMDIIWLQRDLGLYVVGLFDTGIACEALHYSSRSLAYLLQKFVSFEADKKYQLADWRIRPIPDEMLYYARSDTHYLLYIFDHLRNLLLEASEQAFSGLGDSNPMQWVLEKSKEQAAKAFAGTSYGDDGRGPSGWYKSLYKMNPPWQITDNQFGVYRAAHKWRDQLAREDDESTNYIMPQHVLISITTTVPANVLDLKVMLGPRSHVRDGNIGSLWAAISQAMADPSPLRLFGTVYSESLAKRPSANAPPLQATTNAREKTPKAERAPLSQAFGNVSLSALWEDEPAAHQARVRKDLESSNPLVRFLNSSKLAGLKVQVPAESIFASKMTTTTPDHISLMDNKK